MIVILLSEKNKGFGDVPQQAFCVLAECQNVKNLAYG